MMFDLDSYLNDLISNCRTAFGDRLLYVGLQGSYLRGEAHEDSDIDVMVIIDRFSVRDMDTYREILQKIGFYERSCGFICGKEEMKLWTPLEVCQLRHTTKDLLGVLTDHLPPAAREDEISYVRLSLGNLYHELCHRYIHADRDRNEARFRGACKGVFFLMQNLHYLESGRFVLTEKELREAVSEEDRRVLELAGLPDGFDFDQAFSALFAWCQAVFTRVERLPRRDYPLTADERAAAIEIKQADSSNFRETSLDSFDRFQEVQNVWRMENGRLVLVFHPFTETWSPERRREKAREILSGRYITFCAFEGDAVVGEIMLLPELNENRLVIDSFHVSRAVRRCGIGRRLLETAADYARGRGASALYASCCCAEETVAFHKAMGFRLSEYPIPSCVEDEPFDIQMECGL